MWQTRTLEELRVAEFPKIEDGNALVLAVNREEAVLLHQAGATVTGSGCRNLNQATQRFSFEGKTYFWLAGYGSGSWNDKHPVESVVDGRVLAVMVVGRF